MSSGIISSQGGSFYIGGNGYNGWSGPKKDATCWLCQPAFYTVPGGRISPENCPNCAGTQRDPIPNFEVTAPTVKLR